MSFISETELPGRRVSQDQLQVISHRYYFASRFTSESAVLEVGCGPGLGLGYLSKNAKFVIGGDITADSLQCARGYYKETVNLIMMDAHKLPFKRNSFDVIICVAAIIYLDLPSFLGECRLVLRKGGRLILNTPNKDIPGFRESRLSREYYSVLELKALLNQYHFDAELFGAFPMSEKLSKRSMAWQEVQTRLIATASKILDIIEPMPRGKEFREFLNRVVGKRLVLGNEIENKTIETVKNLPLDLLSGNSPDFQHRIVYAVAQLQ